MSVAFVDIDHFKAVNDTYGHAAGDEVLRGVAEKLRDNLRATDLVGRYGGEEFMLILTETEVEDGALLTEKLRILIERTKFPVEGNPDLAVTISIGLAGGFGHSLRVEPLVRDADAAMYSAKSLGRNQTYIFAEPDDDARVPRAPISSDGRAAAFEVGRIAREAATNALTSAVAPLPHYRGQPSALIATIVVAMARQLDLSESEIDRLKIAALLHDVGKVAVPEDILEKPSALTSAEWRTVVQHPRIGQVILEQAAALKDSVPIILHHHERFAGHGYPYGLRGAEIPMGARIVAIADAYDAMVNDRPYKRAMSHADAIEELRSNAGTQFDPELVAVFCDLFASLAPEPDQTILAINAMHSHRRVPAQAGRRRRYDPTVSGPRPARHDRAAASSGMTDAAHASEGGPGPDPQRRRSRPGRAWTWSVGDPRGDLDGCRGGRRSNGTDRHATRCRTARTRPNLRSPARHRLGLIVLPPRQSVTVIRTEVRSSVAGGVQPWPRKFVQAWISHVPAGGDRRDR